MRSWPPAAIEGRSRHPDRAQGPLRYGRRADDRGLQASCGRVAVRFARRGSSGESRSDHDGQGEHGRARHGYVREERALRRRAQSWNPERFGRRLLERHGRRARGRALPRRPGSDTGGSIRIPAACNGFVGLRPGFGRLPLDGVTLRCAAWTRSARWRERRMTVRALPAMVGVSLRRTKNGPRGPDNGIPRASAQCSMPRWGRLHAALDASGARLKRSPFPELLDRTMLEAMIDLMLYGSTTCCAPSTVPRPAPRSSSVRSCAPNLERGARIPAARYEECRRMKKRAIEGRFAPACAMSTSSRCPSSAGPRPRATPRGRLRPPARAHAGAQRRRRAGHSDPLRAGRRGDAAGFSWSPATAGRRS